MGSRPVKIEMSGAGIDRRKEFDMTLSKAALRVIELAQRMRDYYESELPKHHADYPIVHANEPGPPRRRKRRSCGIFSTPFRMRCSAG